MHGRTPGETPHLRDSRSEYERRIHRVVAHIDAHLANALDLGTLASVANFSAFHFHRVFQAWTGETLADYVRRRRVETAALRLIAQPRLSVTEAAFGVGFGSGEAFSRAFRLRFGRSPSAWRKERNPGQVGRKNGRAGEGMAADHGVLPTLQAKDPAMQSPEVSLVDMPPTPVAYHRHTGAYGPAVSSFWMERVAPWMAENDLFSRARYGIAHDDPTITEPARCRYDACVEADASEVMSGNPMRTVLPGGRYACMRFEGTIDDIDAAWKRLLSDWLPGSGLQLDARPMLEHYPQGSNYDPETGVFDCGLCAPVTAL